MSNFSKLSTILLLMITFFIGVACQTQQDGSSSHMDTEEQYEDTVPLIYHMSFIQRYGNKLYFAGMEENWELADIYSHEIEEISETIIGGEHVDDGVNVSDLLKAMLVPQIENIESAIDAKDRALFETNYQAMIQTCNQCHEQANYGAVKITIPDENPYNQDFSVPSGN